MIQVTLLDTIELATFCVRTFSLHKVSWLLLLFSLDRGWNTPGELQENSRISHQGKTQSSGWEGVT